MERGLSHSQANFTPGDNSIFPYTDGPSYLNRGTKRPLDGLGIKGAETVYGDFEVKAVHGYGMWLAYLNFDANKLHHPKFNFDANELHPPKEANITK